MPAFIAVVAGLFIMILQYKMAMRQTELLGLDAEMTLREEEHRIGRSIVQDEREQTAEKARVVVLEAAEKEKRRQLWRTKSRGRGS